jgi:hypothetical protein
VVHQVKTIKLVELNFIFKKNALFERKSKAKNKFLLTFDLNYAKTWPLPTFTASLFWESRLSNDIWYRCVAHGFITFYFLILYRWSINWMWSIGILKRQKWNVILFDQKPVIWVYAYQSTSVNGDPYFNHFEHLLLNGSAISIIVKCRWSWSYGSWIYTYLYNQCLSPLKL